MPGSRSLRRRSPLAVAGAVLLVLFVLAAVAAPLIAPQDPAHLSLSDRLTPPSAAHWFGTDALGRDLFSRTVYGSRISLSVALSVVGISLVIGTALGAVSGFYAGPHSGIGAFSAVAIIDPLINTLLINAFMSLPGILLAIAFVAFLGPGIGNLIFALSLTGWVTYARLARAQVMLIRDREFVLAARSLGARDRQLMLRHILPNIVQPLAVQAAVGLATAVMAEATLSFLGLGVPPPAPSWGTMLNDARTHLFDAPWLALFPAAAVMLCVLAFNFLGDALRDRLDPKSL